MQQHRAFALDQREFRAALRGEVLDEAVHLDRGAVGRRHGLRDHPQMPDARGRLDPERHVERPALGDEFVDRVGQRPGVLREGQTGQPLRPYRLLSGSQAEHGVRLRGPGRLLGDQVPVRPAEVAEPLHIGEALLLPVHRGVPQQVTTRPSPSGAARTV